MVLVTLLPFVFVESFQYRVFTYNLKKAWIIKISGKVVCLDKLAYKKAFPRGKSTLRDLKISCNI